MPYRVIVNSETGEQERIELTEEEYAQYLMGDKEDGTPRTGQEALAALQAQIQARDADAQADRDELRLVRLARERAEQIINADTDNMTAAQFKNAAAVAIKDLARVIRYLAKHVHEDNIPG